MRGRGVDLQQLQPLVFLFDQGFGFQGWVSGVGVEGVLFAPSSLPETSLCESEALTCGGCSS